MSNPTIALQIPLECTLTTQRAAALPAVVHVSWVLHSPQQRVQLPERSSQSPGGHRSTAGVR